jgi:hypothetical protein
MSNVTPLATARLSATDTLVIELVGANERPAVVIVRLACQGIDPPPATVPRRCSRRSTHVRCSIHRAGRDQVPEEAVSELRSASAVLDQIRERLLAEAESSVAAANGSSASIGRASRRTPGSTPASVWYGLHSG